MIKVLTSNHYEEISSLFSRAQKEIKIVSPYLSPGTADTLCKAAKCGIRCTFITRVYTDDFLQRSNSIDALRKMLDSGITVYAMIALHAKLYLFDNNVAVLGSANFTENGLNHNYELSIEAIDEEKLLSELNSVYSSMISQITERDSTSIDIKRTGLITYKLLDVVQADCDDYCARNNKGSRAINRNRYGADIRDKAIISTESKDTIEKDIRSEQSAKTYKKSKKQKHHIWFKQEGTDEDRGDGTERKEMACVQLNGKDIYIANSKNRFASFNGGDEIYIVNQSRDKSKNKQRMIVGRGVLRAFSDKNIVSDKWCTDYPWMKDRKYYCIIDSLEILDTPCMNGIRFDDITQQLNANTFAASYGKTETPTQLTLKWRRKGYLEASQEAKELIDAKFDELAKKYGIRKYKSE